MLDANRFLVFYGITYVLSLSLCLILLMSRHKIVDMPEGTNFLVNPSKSPQYRTNFTSIYLYRSSLLPLTISLIQIDRMFVTELLEIPEGKVFWRFDSPTYGEGEASTEAESGARDRPTLLFIHAGVSNHTLWDETIDFLTVKGWGCVRILGIILSRLSNPYRVMKDILGAILT